jgi:uncharacterized protein with HEPN domain
LVHGYFETDKELVWRVVEREFNKSTQSVLCS